MFVSWFSLVFHPLMFLSVMVVSMFKSDFISATEAREMARRGGFEAMLFDVCDMCELKGVCADDDCGAHLFPLDVNSEPSKPWSEL